MDKWLRIALMAIVSVYGLTYAPEARADQRIQGDCQIGGQTVTTGGVASTTEVMYSAPGCTVQVFNTGTLVNATLYSDNNRTPLANPLTANSTTGHWSFYIASGSRVDIQMSGGTPALPSTVTLSDVLAYDPITGGSGSVCAQTFSATPTFTALSCSIISMTLTGNISSSTITNSVTGQQLVFSFCQDAVGGRTVAWPASFLRPPAPTTIASACSTIKFWFDGVNWRHVSSGDSASFAQQISSSLLTGTAPFSIASTTVVPNLNVSQLLGGTWAVPGAIGSTTPNTGVFTTVNKVTITQPATGSTLTIVDGKTLRANNTLTFAGTDGTTQTFPASPPTGGVLSYGGPTFQKFTGNGTFTIPTGVTAVKVTIIGGGGAGGGSTAANVGAGGGSGGYAVKWLAGLTPGNTITVTVGAAGAANSGAAGGAGGDSSISSGTQTITTVTAKGGSGGASQSSTPIGGGAGGAVSTNGDINGAGVPGAIGYATGAGTPGGSTFLGGAGTVGGVGGAGSAAVANTGSGGGGAAAGGTFAGGAGAAGLVIFEWTT